MSHRITSMSTAQRARTILAQCGRAWIEHLTPRSVERLRDNDSGRKAASARAASAKTAVARTRRSDTPLPGENTPLPGTLVGNPHGPFELIDVDGVPYVVLQPWDQLESGRAQLLCSVGADDLGVLILRGVLGPRRPAADLLGLMEILEIAVPRRLLGGAGASLSIMRFDIDEIRVSGPTLPNQFTYGVAIDPGLFASVPPFPVSPPPTGGATGSSFPTGGRTPPDSMSQTA